MFDASPLNMQCPFKDSHSTPIENVLVVKFPSFVACQQYHTAHGGRPMTWKPRPERKKSTSRVMAARW